MSDMDEAEYRRKVAFWAWFGMMVCGAGALALAVILAIVIVRVVR